MIAELVWLYRFAKEKVRQERAWDKAIHDLTVADFLPPLEKRLFHPDQGGHWSDVNEKFMEDLDVDGPGVACPNAHLES